MNDYVQNPDEQIRFEGQITLSEFSEKQLSVLQYIQARLNMAMLHVKLTLDSPMPDSLLPILQKVLGRTYTVT